MPYGTINLLYGVPKGETPVTCTAGVGTFVVEFGALTQLTGATVFMEKALRALQSLWFHKSSLGLVGNHIDVATGKWTALDSTIGAGVDSYFEYLVKGAMLFGYPDLMKMFVGRVSVIVCILVSFIMILVFAVVTVTTQLLSPSILPFFYLYMLKIF